MRLFVLEVKRITKTKLTWMLLAAALVLSVLAGYIPVTFETAVVLDETGREVRLTGTDAVRHYQQYNDTLYGEVTEEMITEAVRSEQKVYAEYGSEYGENIPNAVYCEKLSPLDPLVREAQQQQLNPGTGSVPSIPMIDTEKLAAFYEKLPEGLPDRVWCGQKGFASAVETALARFSAVETPYTYYYGAGTNALDYQTLLMLIVTLLCVVIAAPVFSTDFQTGADDIQRCARKGKLTLGVTKAATALFITIAAFAVCLTVCILTANTLFGWQGTRTSMQMLYGINSMKPWNVGQLQWYTMLYTLLFLICTISFTLLISVKMKSNATAMALSLGSAVLPILLYIAVPKKYGTWLQCFLASGGIGTGNSILYMLTEFDFVHMGSASFWNVDMLLLVTAVEIPVFLLLTVIAYCRKEYSPR